MAEQGELLPVEHRSLQPSRLRKRVRRGIFFKTDVNAERVYAARWLQQNRRRAFVNGGFTQLEWILCADKRRLPDPVSRRDAAVAASVIQWLGTSAGLGFIMGCEQAIEVERGRFGLRPTEGRPSVSEARVARPRRGIDLTGRELR